MKFFLLAINILLLGSCEPSDNRLSIVNRSKQGIYCIYSKGFELNATQEISLFRDTLMRLDTLYQDYLNPNSETLVPNMVKWEYYINETPGNCVNFYFLSTDTLSTYSWSDICRRKLYRHRLSYTLKDLEKMNWKIVYPIN